MYLRGRLNNLPLNVYPVLERRCLLIIPKMTCEDHVIYQGIKEGVFENKYQAVNWLKKLGEPGEARTIKAIKMMRAIVMKNSRNGR
jgi:hypothetical protein